MPDFHTRNTCRACGSKELTSILNLGSMPPANAFIKIEDFAKEQAYPLELFHCSYCGLAQLTTEQRFKVFRDQFRDYPLNGLDVVNCTAGSALTCFPMARLEDVL